VVTSEATLVEQPCGKELEYRIIVVNKAGDGKPSDTAKVVLQKVRTPKAQRDCSAHWLLLLGPAFI